MSGISLSGDAASTFPGFLNYRGGCHPGITMMNSSDPTPHRTSRIAFPSVVGLFLAYAGFFIYRTSFTVAGERYFSLFDDGMISMRYARHLAHGSGLVWNPGGQRVEGFTNPLWTLYMAAIHLLPVPLSKTSLLVQATASPAIARSMLRSSSGSSAKIV